MTDTAKPLALFPVYLYEAGFVPDHNSDYYLVAANGVFFHKKSAVGSALVPVIGIPWLEIAERRIDVTLPKMPGAVMAQALTFFRKVNALHSSEACLLLYFSPTTQEFCLHCPTQIVSPGSVEYDRADQMPFNKRMRQTEKHVPAETMWLLIGTIHSHGSLPASHSGTDRDDEATFNGLHVVLGHVDCQEFSIVSTVSMNGYGVELEPTSRITDIMPVKDEHAPGRTVTASDRWSFAKSMSETLQGESEVIDQWMTKITVR